MRIVRNLGVVVLLVAITGCPFPQRILPGLWVIYFDGSTTAIGIRLFFNGETENLDTNNLPPGVDSTFSGHVTWSQVGSEVTIINETSSSKFVHTGHATDRIAISGTYVQIEGTGELSGYWAAVRLGD